ncbi:ArnT family glycosyltransferase [Sphingobacterium lumbrici]|uniref:ArnT family glycosyltransferase n=1 Tax=Sphingobacterium lumbrici TaxID=2559600 RepID=UPI00112A56BE|nr:glycosyltransferase family 39 protein [Sphingobacterium lumbrici]
MASLIKNFKIQYFLLFWACINLIQGTFMELHVDEAYYWIYNKFLDWGYYDHPPMVAVFIKVGTFFTHSALGVRLISIISNVCAIYFLWQIVKPYANNVWLFACLYCSFVIFHVYGFINSPDSPLLFFAILYFYFLKGYLHEKRFNIQTVLCLSLVITGMLYSKYHGILLLFFTILADWKLLKRPSFWSIVLLSLALYLPHILWQIKNDYPSIQFHVFERNAREYKISFTLDYLLSLILVVGPLSGWYLYYRFFKLKNEDTFLRILKFVFWGFLIFFFLSSFKSRVQAQWVLLAYIPLFILGYIALARYQVPKWFYTLLYSTIALIMVIRLALIIPVPALQKIQSVNAYWGHADLASQLKEKAKGRYLIFDNGFQDASSYNFYTNTTTALSYNPRTYRKTQYDYWPIEDSLRNKNVYFVRPYSFETIEQDTITSELRGAWYGTAIDTVRLYQKVEISCDNLPDTIQQGKKYHIRLSITNPYDEEITFDNTKSKWPLFFEYGYTKYVYESGEFFEFDEDYHVLKIAPKQTKHVDVSITAPSELGERLIMFSLRTDPFIGPRNSKKYPIYVTEN